LEGIGSGGPSGQQRKRYGKRKSKLTPLGRELGSIIFADQGGGDLSSQEDIANRKKEEFPSIIKETKTVGEKYKPNPLVVG